MALWAQVPPEAVAGLMSPSRRYAVVRDFAGDGWPALYCSDADRLVLSGRFTAQTAPSGVAADASLLMVPVESVAWLEVGHGWGGLCGGRLWDVGALRGHGRVVEVPCCCGHFVRGPYCPGGPKPRGGDGSGGGQVEGPWSRSPLCGPAPLTWALCAARLCGAGVPRACVRWRSALTSTPPWQT
jgi:hypothetical protein